MSQVTIYLSEDLIDQARQKARSENRSLSSWIAALVRRETEKKSWPKSLVDVLTEGRADLVEPDDPLPEDVEGFS